MSDLIEINLRGSRQLEEFRLRRTPLVDVYLEPLGHLRDGIAKTRRELDRDERILYALGRLVFEDFTEVVVNCANGLTTGAMKIQRGMYERTVTLLYLDQNPSEIEKFLNFFPIADWKKIQEARRVMPDSVPAEFYEQKKLEYEAVRQAYMVPACRVCSSARKKAPKGHMNPGKAPALTESLPCIRFREIIGRFKLLVKRPEGDEKAENSLQPDATRIVPGCTHQRVNHTWSDLDVVAMSEKLEGFKDIRFLAYYTNMEETHSTVHAILRRFTGGMRQALLTVRVTCRSTKECCSYWLTNSSCPQLGCCGIASVTVRQIINSGNSV